MLTSFRCRGRLIICPMGEGIDMDRMYLTVYREIKGEMVMLESRLIPSDVVSCDAEWVLDYLDRTYIRTVSFAGNINWQIGGRYIEFTVAQEVVTVRDLDDELLICSEGEV